MSPTTDLPEGMDQPALDSFGLKDGWLTGPRVSTQESPNHNERPQAVCIDSVVIHCISLPERGRETRFIEDLFLNRLDWQAHPSFGGLRDLTVSSHFLIDRDGAFTQFVSCDKRAWHAGVSAAMGRESFNDFSIGIELLGDVYSPYSYAQILALNTLLKVLITRYPIQFAYAHSEIAPTRKTDPGPFFDWEMFRVSGTYRLKLS